MFGEDAGKLYTPPLALISHILTLQIDSHSGAAAALLSCPTIQMNILFFHFEKEEEANEVQQSSLA